MKKKTWGLKVIDLNIIHTFTLKQEWIGKFANNSADPNNPIPPHMKFSSKRDAEIFAKNRSESCGNSWIYEVAEIK